MRRRSPCRARAGVRDRPPHGAAALAAVAHAGQVVPDPAGAILIQRKIPDLNSGLRIVRRDVSLRYMHLLPHRLLVLDDDHDGAACAAATGSSFVPIQVERRVGKSTVSARTGFQTILLVLRLASLFNPLRIFLPLSFVSLLAGVAWAIPYLFAAPGLTVASMLLILTGVLLFALGLICDQVAQLRLERYE